MRTVTSTLAAAILAPERVMRPRVTIDWDNDGANLIDYGDTFQRTVSNGFGITSTGYTYTTTGSGGTLLTSDFQVTPGTATQSVPVANAFRIAVLGTSVVSFADQDITVEWSCPSVTGGDLEPGGLYLYCQDTANYLLVRVAVHSDNTMSLILFHHKTSADDSTLASVVLPYTYSAATHWYTEGQMIGGLLRARVWPATSTKPRVWHATAYDSTWTTGGWGVRSGRASGNTNASPVVFPIYKVTVATSPYDDVSAKVGPLTITRDMTGQLPSDVLVVEGISAATADGELAVGDSTDERLDAVSYWSLFNSASPLYGKSRANRTASIAQEWLTSAGWERVPRLTNGVLQSLPVNVGNGSAAMSLLDARDRFRTPIALPAVAADAPVGDGPVTKPGLEASWIASYALAQCGVPLSPPARTGAIWHVPMHGSAVPFVQRAFAGSPESSLTPTTGTDASLYRCTFSTTAPFFMAADPTTQPGGSMYVASPGTDPVTTVWDGNGRATVRMECWVYVTGSETVSVPVVLAATAETSLWDATVTLRVQTTGLVSALVENWGTTRTVVGPTITLNAWHLVGVDINDAGGSAAFRMDGTTTVVGFTATPVVIRTFAPGGTLCSLSSQCRIAEVHVTTSLTAANTWLPTAWTQAAAQLDRLQNRLLTGIYPGRADDTGVVKTVEAWALLQELVAAERGLVFIDYDGVCCAWSRARLNTSDSLTAVRTVTAKSDILELGYSDDRSMIRNVINVPYRTISASPNAPVYSLDVLVSLGPLETKVINGKFSDPLGSATLSVTGTVNTQANGSGAAAPVGLGTPTYVLATTALTSASTFAITLQNRTGGTFWFVDNLGVPNLVISGTPLKQADSITATVSDAASSTEFGPTPLDVDSNQWIQTSAYAYGTAYQLLALLRNEQYVVTDLSIIGDPRLEFLDRIRVQDPNGLVLDAELTIEGIDDDIQAPGFDQSLVGRPARQQWIAGPAGVGTPIGTSICTGTP